MPKEKISLVVDKDLWDRFKAYCQDNAFSYSKKIELLIKNEMETKGRKEKKQQEVMELLAEMISQKEVEKKEVEKQKDEKRASQKTSKDVTDLKSLTERYLEKKKGRL